MEMLIPIIQKLAFPYHTLGGPQLIMNVDCFLSELEKQGIKLEVDFQKNFKKTPVSIYKNFTVKEEPQKQQYNRLTCKKCGEPIKRLLFGKMQLCNKCHAD